MSYFHVRITTKAHRYPEVKLDLTREELEQRVLQPYYAGRPITVRGKSIATADIERVQVNETEQNSTHLRPIAEQQRASSGVLSLFSIDSDIARMGEDVTDRFITAPAGNQRGRATLQDQELRPAKDAREVFVVHGRNNDARRALFGFLRAIGLHPLEWSEAVQATGKTAPYISEILDAAFSRAHAVVVLFTPDDEARLREPFQTDNDPPHETRLTGQARPNVLFESGMAMARHQDRTILVELGSLRPFSDLDGLHKIRLDDTSQRRQELAQRLQAAGCPVNLHGTDWHSIGDFDAALIQDTTDPSAAMEESPESSEQSQLSEDARGLLLEAIKDPQRAIYMIRTMGGVIIKTSTKSFAEMGDRRSEAKWEQALEDLVNLELVRDPRGNGNYFEVTHEGFQTADALQAS